MLLIKARLLLCSSGEEKRGKSPGEPPGAPGQEDHLVSHVHLDSISKGYITTGNGAPGSWRKLCVQLKFMFEATASQLEPDCNRSTSNFLHSNGWS